MPEAFARAQDQPDVDNNEVVTRRHDGTRVPLPYREYMATTSTALAERYSGLGLTLDDVIADQQETAAFYWKDYNQERPRRFIDVETPEAWCADVADVVIWAGSHVQAVLRLTMETYPLYEVTWFGLPSTRPPVKVVPGRNGNDEPDADEAEVAELVRGATIGGLDA